MSVFILSSSFSLISQRVWSLWRSARAKSRALLFQIVLIGTIHCAANMMQKAHTRLKNGKNKRAMKRLSVRLLAPMGAQMGKMFSLRAASV
jgi:hypothetical protein